MNYHCITVLTNNETIDVMVASGNSTRAELIALELMNDSYAKILNTKRMPPDDGDWVREYDFATN